MEWQLVIEALRRIEAKLDAKAEQKDHQKLEERVRKNEQDLVKVSTVWGLLTAAVGYVGWKF